MACCGKERQQFLREAAGAVSLRGNPSVSLPRVVEPSYVYFEYVGTSSLTVLGPISGRRYRFDGSGARAAVDRRDAPSIMAVPELRQVRA